MSRPASQTTPMPLPSTSLETLQHLSATLSQAQLMWASGYLAGSAGATAADAASISDQAIRTTVLFATETGNSRRVAEALVTALSSEGFTARAVDARDFKISQFKKERRVIVVAATHGLGDAPDGSEDFFASLASNRAPRLEHMEFAVLGLGDSSYDDFCQVGIDTDLRLEALGAKRILPRVDSDLDYDLTAKTWSQQVVEHVVAAKAATPKAAPQLRAVPTRTPTYSPSQPYTASVLTNQRITGRDSSKTVQHIELSLEGSELRYTPGDALGVITPNPPETVETLLETLGTSGSEPVTLGNDTLTLSEALSTRLDITASHRSFAEHYARTAQHSELAAMLQTPGKANREFFYAHQIVDLLRNFPGDLSPQQLVEGLRSRQPRLYSIASSLDANPEEVHLTVAQVRYQAFDQMRYGSVSTALATELESVPVYIEPNPHFRLPENADTPIVMIGPGTGIAPFRAFLEHRAEHGARGASWLFFGDRTMRHDFLYQLELQRRLRDGTLSRLDVAFSRDQAEKIYVQQRLRERATELYAWLQEGAHVYVCGDADRMAPDVHRAMQEIVAHEGGMTSEDAENYLRELKRDNRYQRDVY